MMKNFVIAAIALILIGSGYVVYSANRDRLNSLGGPAEPSVNPGTLYPSPPLATAPQPVTTPPVTEETGPFISSPLEGDPIQSPLIVTGTVPPGWMFEGKLNIKLFTYGDVLLAQTSADEKVPGSWQSGEPVEFTARLTYTTDAKYGYILLEKANPSGLTENEGFYKRPILFSD